ncbi:MAG TPA: imelysin family protein [Flavihumibacter sp.]|nr:imelysin family protein [Flavihumibacter sp.]
MNTRVSTLLLLAAAAFSSCQKDDDKTTDVTALKKDILVNVSTNVITASYTDMNNKATALANAVTALESTTNDANLSAARQAWKDMRVVWEQTEAWLYGPVSSEDIDPRIDTWPVDFNALDAQLAGSAQFTAAYIDALPEDLKGFHPIEYLLWGKDGSKTAAAFTAREKSYLQALTDNLVALSKQVDDAWKTGYSTTFATAGQTGNSTYTSLQSAYLEMVAGMADICEEVANGKMKDPFDAQDPNQEESPFAKNSITDFTNNIQGILKMYQGDYNQSGVGLEDLVRNYNLSLDSDLKAAHAAAIAALNAITVPFGQAITSQQSQVQTAMAKINALHVVLQNQLQPFVQQYAK